jgi:hypothetical protein
LGATGGEVLLAEPRRGLNFLEIAPEIDLIGWTGFPPGIDASTIVRPFQSIFIGPALIKGNNIARI